MNDKRLFRLLPLALVLLFIPVIFWRMSFSNLIFARGDTFYYFYPYWEHRARAILAGEIPLWNPYLFMGAPFLANSQAGVLYPFNWPLAFFDTPYAVKLSTLFHLGLAACGTFFLARRTLNLPATAAGISALIFTLSGHLTTKVEQVNQAQGLAWFPWLVLTAHLSISADSTAKRLRAGAWFALILAFQILAGHTQSMYISLMGAGIWVATFLISDIISDKSWRDFNAIKGLVSAYWVPIPFIALAIALSAAQLLPTLELSQNSMRSGGMSAYEAVSFSLHPLLIGRGFLPGYSRTLFSEFLGYVGIIALFFTINGALKSWGTKSKRAILVLFIVGFALALGGYNPIYWGLLKVVPGFDLFRAPARWLILWSLATALLTGYGVTRLAQQDFRARLRPAILGVGTVVGLIAIYYLSRGFISPGELGPPGPPKAIDYTRWGIATLLGLALLLAPEFRYRSALIGLLVAGELFLASQVLPLNRLTTPETYFSLRPAMLQMVSANADEVAPGRFLSMSQLQFDPGDIGELKSIWEGTLPDDPLFDALVATKAKEVLSPNLPLVWQVPSVDGYDGGVLPLRSYAEFTQQFTGQPEPSTDGRLREYLIEQPEPWLLNITDTRWLVTDKTADVWIGNVFYDLQNQLTLDATERSVISEIPPLEATGLGIIMTPQTVNLSNSPLGFLEVFDENGAYHAVPIPIQISVTGEGFIPLPEPMTLESITIRSERAWEVNGLALVDQRTGAFQPLTLGAYRLAHSGDVKIYENLDTFGRAFMVESLPLTNSSTPLAADVEITSYANSKVTISVVTEAAGTLVLADSMYPGWQARVNNAPTDIQLVNGLFRGIELDAGEHEVVFDYKPRSWQLGKQISLASVAAWVVLVGATFYWKKNEQEDVVEEIS